MLTQVEIHDFALIEQAVLEPGAGLFIISGETGAGKSILIDAIGALTGERVSRDVIRQGQSRARIEAVFSQPRTSLPLDWQVQLGLAEAEDVQAVAGPAAAARQATGPGQEVTAREAGQAADTALVSPVTQAGPAAAPDDDLIVSREILASGKSNCRINGRLVPLAVLRQTVQYLIDIHGQNDQQSIFSPATHIQLLDRFAGDGLQAPLAAYQQAVVQWSNLQQQLHRLGQDPAERARQLDLLDYQIREISGAAIRPGEEEQLTARRRLLANREKIREALSDAYEQLSGSGDTAINARLARLHARLDFAARQSETLAGQRQLIESSLEQLQSAAAGLLDFLEDDGSDPGELVRLDERLDLFYRLKKKYGGDLASVQAYLSRATARREELADGEARFERLQKQQEKIARQISAQADTLSDLRQAAASRLQSQIMVELADLGMKGVRFAVKMEKTPLETGPYPRSGLDRVEFMISPNPGEPLKPLARIASGGEASRVLLAIKTILADVDAIPVLIFDEIDTGVSGRTAGRVAAKLKQIARRHQVLCITHMAQIAALADQHLLIEKQTDGEKTRTLLRSLDQEGRIRELARLLSGGIGDEAARQLAEQLLTQGLGQA